MGGCLALTSSTLFWFSFYLTYLYLFVHGLKICKKIPVNSMRKGRFWIIIFWDFLDFFFYLKKNWREGRDFFSFYRNADETLSIFYVPTYIHFVN